MPLNRRIVVSRPLLEVGCTLGEGPLYDPKTSLLHFVDIQEKKVFHLDTVNLQLTSEDFEEPVTCLALRRNKPGLACTTARGFALLNGDSTLQYLCKPLPDDQITHTRFNDGACDSKGRYFAGSVYSKEHGIPGRLYQYDPANGNCTVVDHGPFTDSNGLGWSLDGKTLYFTDSLVNLIYAYDYDDGHLSNRRVFVDSVAKGFPSDTYPDGLCIDSEGCIWSARWGGSRIVRFTPDGEVDMEIFFPTALNITACCFGGPNEDQMYVTTAHCGAMGGDASRQTQFPDSGHLFVVDLSDKFTGGRWRNEFAG